MADIAIFDLDYTLTKRGTWGRFVLKNISSRPHLWLPFALCTAKAQWLYKTGRKKRVSVKKEMMRWSMAGTSKEDIIRRAEAFADKEVPRGLRPGALKALKEHRERGDEIIIASAAVNVIVDSIARRLDVKYWVSTEMKWENGRLAPDFETENCYGAEKLERVKSLFASHPQLKQDGSHITTYSDSVSDLDILRYSDKGVAVNADKKLKAISPSENFDIVEW